MLRTQPDERLAELAGKGSEQAFEELVRRHRANLVTFAGSVAPSGYADDVVQDSLVKAQAALRRGDRPEYAKASTASSSRRRRSSGATRSARWCWR
jgi:DNA-directed RNA polymerase specialized sigma24 family protein